MNKLRCLGLAVISVATAAGYLAGAPEQKNIQYSAIAEAGNTEVQQKVAEILASLDPSGRRACEQLLDSTNLENIFPEAKGIIKDAALKIRWGAMQDILDPDALSPEDQSVLAAMAKSIENQTNEREQYDTVAVRLALNGPTDVTTECNDSLRATRIQIGVNPQIAGL